MDHLDCDHSIRHTASCSRIIERIVRTRNVVKTYTLTVDTMTLICTTAGHLSTTSIPVITVFLNPAAVSLEDIYEWNKNM